MKHIKKLVSLLLVVFIVFTSCIRKETIPPGTKEGDISLKKSVFKTRTSTFASEFGTLFIRENRGAGEPRLISLPVIRIPSINKNPSEPIFYLAGGPGQTNMTFKPPDELLANHDFVMIGYRGVDGSGKLDCPEVKKAIKGDGRDLLNSTSLAKLNQAYCDCATRLQAEGFDLDSYTIPDVIEDMETARKALGYDRINLLSQSYGTRIAQIYAVQHPAAIHRSVMVGVNPPGRFVWEPKTVDRQIEYYNHLWVQDSLLRLQSPDLSQTIRNVLKNMPERWLFFSIDPGKVRLITFAMLYHRNTAALVFQSYILAEKGDPSGLALMSLAYDFMFPGMITWGDLAAKAISADFDTTRNYAIDMDPPGAILGSPFSKLLWSLAEWPTTPIPEEYRKVQHSSVPTLLISGSIDFSTPAEYATNQLLPYLDSGKQVILKEMGHTHDLWHVQRPAMLNLVTKFFDTGEVDDSMFAYSPMIFHVSWGFPFMAKAGLVLVVILFLSVLFVIRFFVKRIKRRSLST